MAKVSVIITNYNNCHNLKNCIESILKQENTKSIEIEIIAVDAGSDDNSQEIFKNYSQIKTLYNTDTIRNIFSPSMCRNIGVENSTGEIIFFIDSDCVAPKEWISGMMTHFKKENVVCVFGGRRPDTGKGTGTFYRNFVYYNLFKKV